jgi:hypothetical protein
LGKGGHCSQVYRENLHNFFAYSVPTKFKKIKNNKNIYCMFISIERVRVISGTYTKVKVFMIDGQEDNKCPRTKLKEITSVIYLYNGITK